DLGGGERRLALGGHPIGVPLRQRDALDERARGGGARDHGRAAVSSGVEGRERIDPQAAARVLGTMAALAAVAEDWCDGGGEYGADVLDGGDAGGLGIEPGRRAGEIALAVRQRSPEMRARREEGAGRGQGRAVEPTRVSRLVVAPS